MEAGRDVRIADRTLAVYEDESDMYARLQREDRVSDAEHRLALSLRGQDDDDDLLSSRPISRTSPAPGQSDADSPQSAVIELGRVLSRSPRVPISKGSRTPSVDFRLEPSVSPTDLINDAAHAVVTADGVTVSSASSSPAQILDAWGRSRTCHWVLVSLFFGFLVVVPMVLVLLYYLTAAEMIICTILAILIPFVLYHLIWRHMLELYPTLAPAAGIWSSASSTFFRVVSKHWMYEIYQLLLTLLSCSTYLYYTYHLDYSIDTDGTANYTLSFSSVTSFVQVEYFLIVSLSMDYLLRLLHATHKFAHIMSLYSFVDLLCFVGVAYFSFWHADLAPKDAIYNYYLFQAPFRFLRMRRALQSLDAPIRSRTGLDLYRLGPFVVEKKTAFFILLILRVFLFICSAAALVLAFEFPCDSLESSSVCESALHEFHICVYFIIVTLSTVGYGDLTAKTSPGRMLMCVIIVYAVMQVPREIQMFSDLEAEQKKAEHAARQARNEQEGIELERTTRPADAINEADMQVSEETDVDAAGLGAASSSPPASSSPFVVSPLCPSPSVGSMNALHSFLADDTPFLCRWAEMRLRANDTHLIRKLAAVVGGDKMQHANDEQKVTAIVQALFASSSPRSPPAKPTMAAF